MYKWFQAHHGLMHADPLLTLSYVFNSFHRIMKPHTHTQGSCDFGRPFGWLDSWTPPWVTDWMPLTHAGWSGFLGGGLENWYDTRHGKTLIFYYSYEARNVDLPSSQDSVTKRFFSIFTHCVQVCQEGEKGKRGRNGCCTNTCWLFSPGY